MRLHTDTFPVIGQSLKKLLRKWEQQQQQQQKNPPSTVHSVQCPVNACFQSVTLQVVRWLPAKHTRIMIGTLLFSEKCR